MITIDTPALVVLFNTRDPDHQRVAHVLETDSGPYVIPALIMAEMAYVVDHRLGHASVIRLLDNLLSARVMLYCGDKDTERIRNLVERYADMPLGFADAAVIACAERHGGRVLTLDHRHFGVVARDAAITILP